MPNVNKFPPLGAIKWHRLVLDESHTVRLPRLCALLGVLGETNARYSEPPAGRLKGALHALLNCMGSIKWHRPVLDKRHTERLPYCNHYEHPSERLRGHHTLFKAPC